MSFYEGLQATAGRLMGTYGRSVTLKRVTPGAFNPTTGTFAAGTTANHPFSAVITDFETAEIDGTLIQVGDKKLIGQPPIEPVVGDTLEDGSKTYRVERLLETKPGPVSLIYELHLR